MFFSTPQPKQMEASRQEAVDAEVEAEKMLQQVEVRFLSGARQSNNSKLLTATEVIQEVWG